MSTSEYNHNCIVIPLTKGYTAIVDVEDADLAEFAWHTRIKRGRIYAGRNGDHRVKPRKTILLHRAILERSLGRPLATKEQIDHINGNGLDNRRNNLRLASNRQNMQNKGRDRDSKRVYKGVLPLRSEAYSAQVTVNGKRIHLGDYNTLEDAAIAYNHAAKIHFGEFANFNDIPGWETQHPIRRVRHERPGRHNTSGYTGVDYDKSSKKWRARITIKGKRLELGNFPTPELAHAAYVEAKKKYNP